MNTLNGGDLRQSVYRAIRHGLMQAHSMLLEPFYAFHLTIPDKMVGRAMTDLERRFAVFEEPVLEDGQAILTGCAPVSSLDGYGPCHNEEEVIEAAGYDPDADLANRADLFSVRTERDLSSTGMRSKITCIWKAAWVRPMEAADGGD